MEKQYLQKFVELFDCLRDAGSILAGKFLNHRNLQNNSYRKVCFAYKKISDAQEFYFKSDLMYNLSGEIETNLYKYPESRLIYLKQTVRQFTHIVLYLNYHGDTKNCSQIAAAVHKVFKIYNGAVFEFNDVPIIYKYILTCRYMLQEFYMLLSAKCYDFSCNLMDIQKELNIYLSNEIILECYLQKAGENRYYNDKAPVRQNEKEEIPEPQLLVQNWDSFQDSFTDRFEKEGVAELERYYIINNKPLYHLSTQPEKDRALVPVVARGFLAYLCNYINQEFQGLFPIGYSFDHLYKIYFDHCKRCLVDKEMSKNQPESRNSKIELIRSHIQRERDLLSEPHRFYYEVKNEPERQNVELILNAASKYWEWLQGEFIESPARGMNIDKILNEEIPAPSLAFDNGDTSQSENKPDHNEKKSKPNRFCPGMPLNIPVEHFRVLTESMSKNGKTFLTYEEFQSFIDRAFCGNDQTPKLSFNKSLGEKLYIQKIFYDFYVKGVEYFPTNQCRDNFIKLLTDNFTGWDFDKVKQNFSKSTKHNKAAS